MNSIIESYVSEASAADEDGVVAIEYVVIAGLVAAGVALTFATPLWTTMQGKLSGLIG
jgi:Flp pilus assembly pilin Flp